MTGAQVLQVARLRAGLTQAELSVLAGRTQAQLSLWESGRRAVPLATLGELVAACGLDLTLELATGDRSLHELAELQQRLAPHERLVRLIAPGHAQRALWTLGQLAELGQDAVLIGGLARVLRGGPAVPAPLAQVTFADPDSAREVLWEAGWTPGEIHDDFAGLHARERFEAPTPGGWPIELIENPAGVPDHRPLRLDAALLPGLPAVLVASVRDLWRIAGASPWHEQDRPRLAELRALLELDELPPAAAVAAA